MRVPTLKEVRGFLAEGARRLLEQPLYSAGISAYRLGVKVAAVSNPKAENLTKDRRRYGSVLTPPYPFRPLYMGACRLAR